MAGLKWMAGLKKGWAEMDGWAEKRLGWNVWLG
jgi:hypothetical protein